MRKLIIIVQIITLFILISSVCNNKISGVAKESQEFYYMTSTGYSIHPNCTPNDEGITATQTKAHEGVVAINVDWVDDKWVIRSPLKLGQKIYIENVGPFSIEDTGYFTEKNFHFDYWNVDIYFEDYDEAKEWGIQKVKVTILRED